MPIDALMLMGQQNQSCQVDIWPNWNYHWNHWLALVSFPTQRKTSCSNMGTSNLALKRNLLCERQPCCLPWYGLESTKHLGWCFSWCVEVPGRIITFKLLTPDIAAHENTSHLAGSTYHQLSFAHVHNMQINLQRPPLGVAYWKSTHPENSILSYM